MLLLRNIKIKNDEKKELEKKIMDILKIKFLPKYEIYKKSIDARKTIVFNYQVLVDYDADDKLLKKLKDAVIYEEQRFELEKPFIRRDATIVGFGPAGIFCAYILAKYGYRPVVIERGKDVRKRQADIDEFLETGILDENSNVQFGEGGAGTFSDGKLTARSKDKRLREVLKILVENGAPDEIMYDQKPHIGTDKLIDVMENMRNFIISRGGVIHFETCMQDIIIENNTLSGIKTDRGVFKSDVYVFALGNSARDTFFMLKDRVKMENKPFAVGFRIEHSQKMINDVQYRGMADSLPAASYQLTYQCDKFNTGVYTFCMCPGGEVINASSEKNHLCVNGMSYYARDNVNANSAIICTIDENIYGKNLLDGIKFQREIEKKAFELGGSNYFAPVQRVDDFINGRKTEKLGDIIPSVRPGFVLSDLNGIYPEKITESIKQAILGMDKKMKGFSKGDSILTAVETRSSCPVRILRDEKLKSLSYDNLYPIGEGAGYAGGIVSSAIDGIKAAEIIIKDKLI